MMRKIMILAAAVLAFAGSPLRAQSAGDYWAGTLAITPSVSLRIGVALVLDDAGMPIGTLDSPDQHAFDIPLSEVQRTAQRLAFTVPSIGGRFDGRWKAETQEWEGSWVQAGQRWPLVLTAGERPERTAPPPIPADWQVPDDAEIGDLIEARLAGRLGAGMVVGVIEPGGTRIVARGDGVTDESLFEIGSITKIFSALLLAEAVERSEVSLDDPVLKHLPPGAAMPTNGGEAITLRQLSQHRSGLPRLPDNMPFGDMADPYADYTEPLLLDFLRSYRMTRAPDSEFEYSNLGVGLLGYVLSRAAGMDYAELVSTRILAPLGMADSGIALSSEQQARMPQGHDAYMQPTSEWHLGVLTGAGALRSTAEDMLRFLGAVLDPSSPIAPAVALTMSGWQPAAGEVTGLGWMGFAPPQGPVLFHGGGTGGFRSSIVAQQATGRGAVVLTNAAVEPSAEDIAFHLIAGLPVSPVSPVPPPPAPPAVSEEVSLTLEQLARVTGTYRVAPGVEGTIRLTDNGLTAQVTGQPALPIYPSAPLEFFWRAVDAQIRFTEEDGRVTGAVLHQDGQDTPLERIGD